MKTEGEQWIGEVTKTVKELDFNLITNSFLIVVGLSSFIYAVWTFVEKKLDK
ncbi:hypothetical protein [Rossellomorea sp. BNER]|uniref:hypothetical protein n=1 Tax=Rossellomorea sp. BNER TaxID=2962031 RepID=UPI003AF2C716|nr:hypothetical protein [Rossellomorea sp. BNER]